nr:hypothetical protein [Thermoflexibacter sp.]
MKKQILSLVLASYTPYVLFGHAKNFAGWEFAFIFYSLCYFLLGFFFHKKVIRPFLYHYIVGSSLVLYAIFLYTENVLVYFPTITPATLIIGFFSYILGYFYGFRYNKKIILLMCLLLATVFVYGNYFVRNYMYHLSLNAPEDSHLYNKYIKVMQLQNLYGNIASNEKFNNKVLVLDFWYTGCGNCMLKFNTERYIFCGAWRVVKIAFILGFPQLTKWTPSS